MVPLPEDRHWIAESAYYKALSRGSSPKDDYQDWLDARKEHQDHLMRLRKNGLVLIKIP